MPRPTVRDIAAAADVSLATVDRVLNRRAGVRRDTVERVEQAIRRIGYVRDIAAANLAKSRHYSFVFILPEGRNSFMRAIEAEAAAARSRGAQERIDISVVTVPAFDGTALVKAVDAVDTKSVAGVAVVAVESPEVSRAVARLRVCGLSVVTLVSDLPDTERDHYAGIDNIAAGRTAATLLGRFLGDGQHRIAVMTGSLVVRDHAERLQGFREVAAAEYPALEIVSVEEGRDDPALVRSLIGDCLAQNPDIDGIYSLGAGNSGLIEALRDAGRTHDVTVVAHELSERSRAALRDGTFDAVIAQDPGHEVRSAIRVLKARVDGVPIVEAQERIRIEIYLRDNLI